MAADCPLRSSQQLKRFYTPSEFRGTCEYTSIHTIISFSICCRSFICRN
nr:MAG TPA: hypothetical protein [Caudoviricetes sp.]